MLNFPFFLTVLSALVYFSQALPSQAKFQLHENNELEEETEESINLMSEQGSYFEGDMKMDEEEVDELFGLKAGIRGKKYRWTNNTVVYKIDSYFYDFEIKTIKDAMKLISSKTCIKFKKRTDEKNYVSVIGTHDGCWSKVGMRGGKQQLNLSRGCFSNGAGTPAHEFIHAIGFYHEQSRTDRDDFVTIHYENLKDPKYKHNFIKYTKEEVYPFGVSYDYGSIMHYGSTFFSKKGKLITIEVKKKGEKIGQREDLSKKDAKKINAMYGCKK